ncbi:EamA family transporter [Desulfovibrio sp. ZJ200]|uniref:EamA family transporter n=1 Tax=Desulfovibrio sp. ZJ200 TaxID=2709792 RepID=UPI0013EB0D12|nr:EamA family transporter [Desulfovibrio sp. ZJ200]
MWKVYALLAALFAALTAIFSKMGVKDVDSNLATAVRVTFILALTWGIAIFTGVAGRVKELSGHTLLFLFLSAVATGLSWLCYFKALQLGEVSRVAPIDKLSVPLAMILAALLLHEPLGLKAVAGGLLITLGSLLLLL